MIQHSLSIPLTIVASLERFGLLSKFSNPTNRRTFTVHLVGAEKDYEIDSASYEKINHLLPGVLALKVVMVGDKLGERQSSREESVCDECKKDGRTRSLHFYPFTYDDYVSSSDFDFDPLDLVLAFNTGIAERPRSWVGTLLYLLSTEAPIVFTSLNLVEGETDRDTVRRLGGDKLGWNWDCEANGWASGRQHFDPYSPDCVWSENLY